MGWIKKDKFGDWVLTNLGIANGGRMSSGNYLSVPTFKIEEIKPIMEKILNGGVCNG